MAIRNLVVTFRTLAKHPAFTLTAILTIALGVGASTAIFSVTNAVLLQPLPYKDPSRLVIAGMDLRKRNVHGLPLSNADYIDLREGTKALFSDFAGVFTNRLVVPREDGTPEQVRLAIVTTNFFQLTGGRVQFGRDFTVQDGMPNQNRLRAQLHRAHRRHACRSSQFSVMNTSKSVMAPTRAFSAIPLLFLAHPVQ